MSRHAPRCAHRIAVAVPCLIWLHMVHVLAGHARFSNYGLIAADVPAAVVAYSALARYGRRWTPIGASGLMLLLIIVAEWLEGELAAGHRLAWPTLADHGWPIFMSAGPVLACAMAVESVRVIRLLRAAVRDG